MTQTAALSFADGSSNLILGVNLSQFDSHGVEDEASGPKAVHEKNRVLRGEPFPEHYSKKLKPLNIVQILSNNVKKITIDRPLGHARNQAMKICTTVKM